jgi:FkbM family methyltransferase
MRFQPLELKSASPLRRLLHKMELILVGSRKIRVDIPELGFSLIVETHAHIGKLLRQNGMYEEHIVNWITSRFSPNTGGVFVDVGANFGWYSCLMSRIAGRRGRVFLFEPEPNNADLLTENLARNGARNCTLFRAAVGSEEATGTLHMAHHSNPGAHTLVAGLYSEGDISVPVVTLDGTILPEIGARRIALLKMDIEGFELEALRGGRGVLDRTDILVLEFSPEFLRRGGYDPSELWAMFADFDTYRFAHGSEPLPLTVEPEDMCDLLLIRTSMHG